MVHRVLVNLNSRPDEDKEANFVKNEVNLQLHICLNSRYACEARLGPFVAACYLGLESIGKPYAINYQQSGQGHAARHAIIFGFVWPRKINAENTTEAGPTARSSSFFKHVLRAECTYHSKEL